MKPTDLMPFGKHKGLPLSEVPKDYAFWLIEQSGFKEKSPALYAFFKTGEDLVDPKAVQHNEQTLKDRDFILAMARAGFREWWEANYGKRLLDAGEWNYIPYLRVAVAAWDACDGLHRAAQQASRPPPPPLSAEEQDRILF